MARPKKLIPSILTESPETLKALVREAETFAAYVQFDIMDGQFVPSKSVGPKDIASLPTRLGWEVHLMVKNPENYLVDFERAGAQRIVFHYEATSSPQEIISQIKNLRMEVGLAINPETPVKAILPLVSEVNSVLLLSVTPGFYGSKFIPEVLDKVDELRHAFPDVEIGMDGGIKENNIVEVARRGADSIYVGSAIFMQPKPKESFLRLFRMIQKL